MINTTLSKSISQLFWQYPSQAKSNLLPGKLWVFLFALCCLCSLGSPFAYATTYYVSTSGSDANTGTLPSSPWRTVAKVNAQNLQPGDTVLFRRGDTWVADPLRVPTSGTSSNPITFGAYGTGNRPKFNGNDSTNFTDWVLGIVQIDGRSWITIDGLEITNTRRDIFGVQVRNGPVQGLTVRNCDIHTNNQTEGYSGFNIQNAIWGKYQPEGRVNNVVIENNLIHGAAWNCLLLNGGVTNVTIRNNTIYDCVKHDGIDIKSVANASTDRNRHFTIRNNRLYNNQNGIFVIDSDDILIEGNMIHNNVNGPAGIKTHKDPNGFNISTTGLRIQRNLMYNIPGPALWMDGSTGAKLYNNTLYNNSQPLYNNNNTNLEYKNNLPYANGSGNIGYNPLFVNTAGGDFRLCEGVGSPVSGCMGSSQAIDSGIDLGLSFQGSAPDLGALESNSSSPLSPPQNLRIAQ